MKVLSLLLLSMIASAETIPSLSRLEQMMRRFAPVKLQADTLRLTTGDRQALGKLIEASHVVDEIFLQQLWSGNRALHARLAQDHSALGKARLHYFWLNKGPWSALDEHDAFLPDVPPKKLPGANFYPEDMTKAEFESWAGTLAPEQAAQARGFFTVIRRDAAGHLRAVPYSDAYRPDLERAAQLLRQAAALTTNVSLRRFLTLRADAFLSNDYYESDLAWMDLDAPIDVTIGPYETYNDEIFGYKAGFEAYVTLRDDAETAKLQFFSRHLQEIENNLPIDPKFRNPKIGAQAPIRVVNEVYAGGDGNHDVRTAAYNLPNDERVIAQKGSKRVMLKNVQEAKFQSILGPISKRVLAPAAQTDLSFDPFFTHILAHELSHGLGPQQIDVNGRRTSPRQELKELHSAIEEAKADATGLFMLQYMYEHGLTAGGPAVERKLYTTFLASAFRSMRFGVKEAHGKGMALQFNYLLDKGGFVANPDGTYAVDFDKIKPAVRDLMHELLTIEATGDYQRAQHMLGELSVIRPALRKTFAGLEDVPTDIEPNFITAGEFNVKSR